MIETNEIWYLCPNDECTNISKKVKSGHCSQCGSKLIESSKPKKIQLNKDIIDAKAEVHTGKWRIVQGSSRKQFYDKIEKWENLGYILIPESLSTTLSGGIGGSIDGIGLGTTILTYSAFMKKVD